MKKQRKESFQPYTPFVEGTEEIGERLSDIVTELVVTDQSFLNRFAAEGMTTPQLRKFSAQWCKVIGEHKRAFTGLINNTPNDLLRADLLTILYDEYGNGDPQMMHTALFARVAAEAGIKPQDRIAAIYEVDAFGNYVGQTWRTGNPAEAYGIVFVFESVGTSFHTKFLHGLERSGIQEHALAYSRLHAVAEKEHAKIVRRGLGVYKDQIAALERGVRRGADALHRLWNGLERHVYDS